MQQENRKVVVIDPEAIDREALAEAARLLRNGGLVAFPTETVYGLGANALDRSAVQRIFEAKDRPSGHPLIVHAPDAEQARQFAAAWPSEAAELAEAFWPGPLTLIIEKSGEIPDRVTGGLPTVGIRVPSHPVARALLEQAGVPVAAPSANPHTRLSPTRAEHVIEGLGDRVDMVVDGGPTRVGIESTVLSLVETPPAILRPGVISRRAIEEHIGPVSETFDAPSAGEARPSPGMSQRHYSPTTPVRLVDRDEIRRVADDERVRETAVLLIDRDDDLAGRLPTVQRLPKDPDGYAEGLYHALYHLDASNCRQILVESPPEDDAWNAVRDRLRRAAT